MSFVNHISIDGNLTKDGEVKFADSGTAVLKFSIAHNTKIKEKEEVSFFDVVAFGKHAEYVADFAVKGSSVTVIGRLTQDRWEKDGQKYSRVKILANQCVFGKVKPSTATPDNAPPPDDDIPF
ncbi:MAG: single-stranded DNA-binding protein [Gallionella sp.]|jgi:single-strand DNA-binding protein